MQLKPPATKLSVLGFSLLVTVDIYAFFLFLCIVEINHTCGEFYWISVALWMTVLWLSTITDVWIFTLIWWDGCWYVKADACYPGKDAVKCVYTSSFVSEELMIIKKQKKTRIITFFRGCQLWTPQALCGRGSTIISRKLWCIDNLGGQPHETVALWTTLSKQSGLSDFQSSNFHWWALWFYTVSNLSLFWN